MEDQKLTRKQYTDVLIKNSGLITMRGDLPLLSRRIFNAFIQLTRREVPLPFKTRVYQGSVRELCEMIGYRSTNLTHLKKAIRKLMKCQIEFNILGKDNKSKWWSVSQIVSEVSISRGLISWEMTSTMEDVIKNPRIYTRLRMMTAKTFNHRAALVLWELATDYSKVNQTPWITLENFRGLTNTENKYLKFKSLSQHVIKKALLEVNKKSEFNLSTEYQKDSKEITHIKFFIEPKTVKELAALPDDDTELDAIFRDLPGEEQEVISKESERIFLADPSVKKFQKDYYLRRDSKSNLLLIPYRNEILTRKNA